MQAACPGVTHWDDLQTPMTAVDLAEMLAPKRRPLSRHSPPATRLRHISSSLSLRDRYRSEDEMLLLFDRCWEVLGLPDFITLNQVLDLLEILEDVVGAPFFFSLDDVIVGSLQELVKHQEIFMKNEALEILSDTLLDVRIMDIDTDTFYGLLDPVDRYGNPVNYFVDNNYKMVSADEVYDVCIAQRAVSPLLVELVGPDHQYIPKWSSPSDQMLNLDAHLFSNLPLLVGGLPQFLDSIDLSDASSVDMDPIPLDTDSLMESSRRVVSLPTTEFSFGLGSPLLGKPPLLGEQIDLLLEETKFTTRRLEFLSYQVSVINGARNSRHQQVDKLMASTMALERRVEMVKLGVSLLKPKVAVASPHTQVTSSLFFVAFVYLLMAYLMVWGL